MVLVNRRGSTSQKGFTLVELMITMLILAILVTIVVLTMNISKNRAQEATCKSNLRTLWSVINQYHLLHHGESYPPDLDTLVTEDYLKSTFTWTCPAGDYGTVSGDYRDHYDSTTGHVSCPRPSHNP